MSVPLLLVTAVWLAALPPGGHATDPPPGPWFPVLYPLGWPHHPYGQGADPYSYLVQQLTNQLKEQSSQLQSLQEKTKLLESKLEKFASNAEIPPNSVNQSQNRLQHLEKKMESVETRVEKNTQDVKVLNSTQVTQRSQLEQQGREQEGQERKQQEETKKLQEQLDRLHNNFKSIEYLNNTPTCDNNQVLSYDVLEVSLPNPSSSVLNVALGKPAAHSSFSKNYYRPPELVVDGNNDTRNEYCQHTDNKDKILWWMVDLQGFYKIVSVKITNRGDCCGERFKDFEIRLYIKNPIYYKNPAGKLCSRHDGPMEGGITEEFTCHNQDIGRFVQVSMPNVGEPMHICEVEVMARIPEKLAKRYQSKMNSRANGTILRELVKENVEECVHECSYDVACSAVNVGPKMLTCGGWQGNICQTLGFGGLQESDYTIPSPGWVFYSVEDVS